MAERSDGNGMPYRVAVTGIGPITAVGTGTEHFWEGLRRERSPIRSITRFDVGPWRTRIAAEVDDFDAADYIEPRTARRMDRFGHFAIASARLAIADAGLRPDELDPDRTAIQMGTALGGMAYAETQTNAFYGGAATARSIDPRVALTTFAGAASCSIAIDLGATGPNATNAMSCASGTIGIGEAWRLIRDGSADAALAGGVEAPLAPMCFGAFAVIRAMSTRNDDPEHACRPFDAGRDGFIMGEGACTLYLERYDLALRRGARIYAEVVGFGMSTVYPEWYARQQLAEAWAVQPGEAVGRASNILAVVNLVMIPGGFIAGALLARGWRDSRLLTVLVIATILTSLPLYMPGLADVPRSLTLVVWMLLQGAMIAVVTSALPRVVADPRQGAAAAGLLSQLAALVTFVTPLIWQPLLQSAIADPAAWPGFVIVVAVAAMASWAIFPRR